MSLLESLLPTPQTLLHLGNLALAVLLASGVALMAAFLCRRRPAPTRYGVLLLGLVLVLAAPALVWLAERAEIGQLQVALNEQRAATELPDTSRETQIPTVARSDELPSNLITERPTWEKTLPGLNIDRSVVIQERRTTVPSTPVELPPNEDSQPVRHVDHSVDRSIALAELAPEATVAPWWLIAQGFAIVWAFGTAASLVGLARGLVRLAAFCRGLEEHPAGAVRQVAAQAAAQVGLARVPKLFVSARTAAPVTLGLFRPAIVLPDRFVEDLSPAQLHAVVLHEMGHVARRDPCVGLAQRLAAALYWWCPLVARLNRQLADLREELCDNYVLRSSADGADLAEVLVALAERVVNASPLPATVSMFEYQRSRGRSRSLEYRIRRLLSMETVPMTHMNRAGVALVVQAGLAMTVVISLTQVRAAGGDAPVAEGVAGAPPAQPVSEPSTSQNASVANGNSDPVNPPAAEEADSERAKLIAELDDLGGWVASWTKPQTPPVVTVSLSGDTITDAFLERLKVLDDLQVLLLGPTRITEAGLTHLAGLPQLRILIVNGAPFSDAFLDRLQLLSQLEELSLHNAEIADEDLKHLTGMTQLKELSLSGNPIHDDGLLHLAALLQLERLSLGNTYVTDAGVQYLRRLPRLQSLGLSSTEVTGVGLDQLAELTELRDLSLGNTQVTDAGLKDLSKLTQLTGLYLGGSEVTNAGLKHLSELTQLTTLDLKATEVTDAGLVSLRGMRRLQTLYLSTRITDAGLENLSGLTQLQTLDLSRTQVTDAGLVHLRGMTQLQNLDLSGRQVTDAGLVHLRGMTQLQTLDLSGTKVTEAGMEHLGGLTRLQTLELPGFPLGDIGLASLQGLSQLQRLDLSGGDVTDAGLRHLRGMPQLGSLDLTDAAITDAALQHLSGLKKLGGLYLANTKITDSGLSHLKQLPELGLLDLSGTRIGDDGLAALSSLRLQILLLDNTQVTDAGLVHLRQLTQLRDLDLTGARVTDDGLKQLDRLSLRRLRLGKTEVTGTGLVHLRLAALRSLYLDDSKPDWAAVRQFKRSLPSVSIHPWTLTWGWDDPARSEGVRFTPTSKKIVGALQDDTRLDFIRTPLVEVTAFLGQQHGIPIQLDEPILRAAGIGTDVPVTQNPKGITLHSALRLTLDQLGLTYAIGDDALLITTVEEGQRLARQGVINEEEAKRVFAKEGVFHRQREKIQTELLKATRFQFAAAPLGDIVAFLNRQHDITIEVDRRALAAAGIRSDVPCTLDVEGVPLTSALRTLLAEVGLTYLIDDEFILITVPNEDAASDVPANSSLPPNATDVDPEQAKVIAELESLGGRIERAEDRPGRPVTDIALYRNKFTDADLEPLDVFDTLQWLHLCQPQIAESELTHLPELNQLKTIYLVRMPVSNTFLESLQKLPQLQELGLALADVSNANLEQIAKLSQLKTLSFRRTPVSDTGLRHLAALTKLESLDLEHSLVTDAGIKYLRQLTRLQLLNLAGTKVTDAGLRHLAGLAELRYLDLSDTQITGAELQHLGNLTQLTDLDLRRTKVDEVGLQHISGLTQLIRLDLGATQVSDAGLKHLRGMDHLEYLRLGSLVTGEGLEHLSNCTALVDLNLYGTKVTDASLSHIGGLTLLTKLNLAGTQITDAGLENLSGLTELRSLDLSGTRISEAGLKHLSGLSKLEQLELPEIPLSDTGLAYLAGLSQLRELDVQGGSVTDQGLRHLRGLPQLVNLNLTDTQITDAGLEHLHGLTNLTILAVARTKVTGAGLVHLRRLAQFRNLDFSETQVTDDGLAHLRGCSQLYALDLRRTLVTDAGIAHLQDLNLGWLKLGDTQVSDAGLAHLRGHTRLELLHIYGTQVTDEGLKYLVGMKVLQTLWLHRTAVTGTGLVHLTELPRLESVSLDESTADAAAVWRFKKEQPKVQIYPETLAWGWDNPARTMPVNSTLGIQRLLANLEDDTRLDFIQAPLSDVAAFLKDQHGIVIQLDSPALRGAGVGANTPVTQRIKGINLHGGLRLTLGELGLTYVLRDDAVVITTQHEAQRLMQQGFINAEEVEHEFRKGVDSRRQGAKTIDVLLKETRFQFAATPLVDVVAQLYRQYAIAIGIDQQSLASAGIGPEVPCTLDVEGVPLASALRTLLDTVGLTYVVDGEFIRITAARKAAPGQ